MSDTPESEEFDPWIKLGITSGGYSSAVDDDGLAVMRAIRDDARYVTDIAKATGLSETHVELWQYIICSARLCEYGTSPRGCWPVDREAFAKFITDWEAYYWEQWVQGDAQ